MNDARGPNHEVLELSVARVIDPVCDRFEIAWKAAAPAGPRPRIEEFMEAIPESGRTTLVRELVLLDIHYRRQAGEAPTADDYRARFPELASTWLVDALTPPLGSSEPLAACLPHSSPAAASFASPDDQQPAAAAATMPRRLGDYRILREVGRGGMGVVYEAIQESLGRHVALKVLPFNSLLGPTHLERFQREARSAAKLHHTNIVPVYGVGAHEGVHYYAMQYIEGRGLDLVVREVKRLRQTKDAAAVGPSDLAGDVAASLVTGRFADGAEQEVTRAALSPRAPPLENSVPADGAATPPSTAQTELTGRSQTEYFRQVARLGVQVAEALEYAHRQGILHRDIKPSNLLLDTAGTVWITDFGLAKAEGGEDLTSPGDFVGTLRYMAPERFRGQSDPRGDVYSLGLTLYELLTLRPAFQDSDRARLIAQTQNEIPPRPRQVDARIPRDLETVVLRAMARDPGDRYATAEALAEDLRRFLADRPILARRSTMLEQTWRWCRRNRAVAALAAALLAALVILAAGSTIAWVLVSFQRDRATAAEQEKSRRLWDSYVEQAHASRLTRQVGQRFKSLDALRQAIELGRSLELGPEQLLRLRNEAIASMALVDLRFERHLQSGIVFYDLVTFDDRMRYYAYNDKEGNVTIRRVADNSEIGYLPRPGSSPTEAVWVKFSPGGHWLVVRYHFPDRGNEFYRWDFRDGRPASRLSLEAQGFYFDISPDGNWLAAGCADGAVGIYDLASGRLEKRVGQVADPQVVVFHPNGRRLGICPRRSRSFVEFDLETPKEMTRYEHTATINAAAWRPDGRLLAIACNDQRIHVWDTASHSPQTVLEGHTGNGVEPFFNHGGQVLISRSWDGSTRLWDPVTGNELLRLPGHFVSVRSDDSQVAVCRDGEVDLWEMAGLGECRRLHHGLIGNQKPRPQDWGPKCVSFSSDGRLLASASLDGVRLWDTAALMEIARLPVGNCVSALFQPGGPGLLTYSTTGLRLWPTTGSLDGDKLTVRLGPPQFLAGPTPPWDPKACWASDGCSLVVADLQRRRALFMQLDRPKNPTALPSSDYVRQVSVSPDGKWAATGSGIKVWDTASGKIVWDELQSETGATIFSPDGRFLVTWGKALRFWHTRVWQPSHSASLRTTAVMPLAFNSDGTLLAIGQVGYGIRLVEADTGREVATLEAPEENTGCAWLCFSPDGSRLAAATGNHTIHLWDLRVIREKLAALDPGLDWDHRPYPPAAPQPSPLQAVVHFPDAPLFPDSTGQEAVGLYSFLLALNPWNAHAYLERGQAYARMGDWKQGKDDCHLALALLSPAQRRRLNPYRAAYFNDLAWQCVVAPEKLRDPERAQLLAETAVELVPDLQSYLNTLGVVHYRLGHFQPSIEMLERSLAAGQGESDGFDLFFLAMSHARLGNVVKSKDCYDLAVNWLGKQQGRLAPNLQKELNAFRAEAESVLATLRKPIAN